MSSKITVVPIGSDFIKIEHECKDRHEDGYVEISTHHLFLTRKESLALWKNLGKHIQKTT